LARTSGAPGKTRECNAYRVDDTFHLLDLPGYGYAGVSKTRRQEFAALIQGVLARPRLTGAVWLFDLRRDPSPDDLGLADVLAERGTPVLVAFTKADKVTRRAREARAAAVLEAMGLPGDQAVITSAHTREGVDDLREAIAQAVA
jgi:GTP-binding protein